LERSKAERNSRGETGREHGRSSYQHTLNTFINARSARRGFAGAASGSAVCGRQPSRGSSVPPSLIFPLFVSLLCLCSVLPCPPQPPHRACHLECFASRRPKVKTFGAEMLALAKPRRVAKPNRRNSEIVENSVPLMIPVGIHVKCSLRAPVCASISRCRNS